MNPFWLIKQSIVLDIKFFHISKWPISKKLEFIYKKYISLGRHAFTKFKLGESFVTIDGQKFYYDSSLGLAGYQGILARHQKLLRIGNVKNVKTVIDVGANIGTFSKFIRDVYPAATVYSVEPIPVVYETLKKNFADDKDVKLFNIAFSDKKGSNKMFFDSQDSLISKMSKDGNIIVKTETLDEFIIQNKIKNIDLLKVDTEGFEKNVLKGAAKALAMTRYLCIEITIANNPNYTISDIMSLLHAKDYNYQLLAFRNFSDTSEGEAAILDCLMKNVNLG